MKDEIKETESSSLDICILENSEKFHLPHDERSDSNLTVESSDPKKRGKYNVKAKKFDHEQLEAYIRKSVISKMKKIDGVAKETRLDTLITRIIREIFIPEHISEAPTNLFPFKYHYRSNIAEENQKAFKQISKFCFALFGEQYRNSDEF